MPTPDDRPTADRAADRINRVTERTVDLLDRHWKWVVVIAWLLLCGWFIYSRWTEIRWF